MNRRTKAMLGSLFAVLPVAGGTAADAGDDVVAAYREVAAIARGLDEPTLAARGDPTGAASQSIAEARSSIAAAVARTGGDASLVAAAWAQSQERLDALEAMHALAVATDRTLAGTVQAAQLAKHAVFATSSALVRAVEVEGADARRLARQIHMVSQAGGMLQLVIDRCNEIAGAGPSVEVAADSLGRNLESLQRIFDGLLEGNAELELERIEDGDARAVFAKAAEAFASLRPQAEQLRAQATGIAPLRDVVTKAYESASDLAYAADRAARETARAK